MKFGNSTSSSLGYRLFSYHHQRHHHCYDQQYNNYRHYHFWVMMLLMVSNMVHAVSSKMSIDKDSNSNKTNSHNNMNHQYSIGLKEEPIKMNILVISNEGRTSTTGITTGTTIATPLTLRTRARTRMRTKRKFKTWIDTKKHKDDSHNDVSIVNNDVDVNKSTMLITGIIASPTTTSQSTSSIVHGKRMISAITQLPLTTINKEILSISMTESAPRINELELKSPASTVTVITEDTSTSTSTTASTFSLTNHTARTMFEESSSVNMSDTNNDEVHRLKINVTNVLVFIMNEENNYNNHNNNNYYNNNYINRLNTINRSFHNCSHKRRRKPNCNSDNDNHSRRNSTRHHCINSYNNNKINTINVTINSRNCNNVSDSSSDSDSANTKASDSVFCRNQYTHDAYIANMPQQQKQLNQQHSDNNNDNDNDNDNNSINNDDDNDIIINDILQNDGIKHMTNGDNHIRSNYSVKEIDSIKMEHQINNNTAKDTLLSSTLFTYAFPSQTLRYQRDQLEQPWQNRNITINSSNTMKWIHNAATTTSSKSTNFSFSSNNRKELLFRNLIFDDSFRTKSIRESELSKNKFISISRQSTTSTIMQQHQQLQQQRYKRQTVLNDEQQLIDKCRMFVEGDSDKYELYSPDYPNNYPPNINCTRVLIAPKGQIIRLDFRNSFHIEDKEECKFDFLEIRDGQYGFSNLIGKYCGTDFPPEITSRERYLWLHFHSDESIEYSGFTAVYEFIDRNRDAPSTDLNCTIDKDGFEGFVNSTDVPQDIRETVIRNKIPLDCMWRIQVQDKWKIQVKFLDFKLSKPNDCETNFLDIFPEQTVMPLRVKNFCGSAGEGITSESNVLHMRFYAEQVAINSSFAILYTAFRDRSNNANCVEGEYDCEDATCIAAELRCNGRDNCKFRWDEEGCKSESEGQKEHMIIIITVFGLILGGMVVTFLVNCIRKILRDQKIIREHIRQSKESKLDELSRRSKTRSRDNLSPLSSRQKHSQTSLHILDDVSNRYYREMEAMTIQKKQQHEQQLRKEKEHSILRYHQHQKQQQPRQHDRIVQTSLCSTTTPTTDSSTTNTTTNTTEPIQPHKVSLPSPPSPPSPPMPAISPPLKIKSKQQQQQSTGCDMGCQTRESLFSTVSLWRHKSKTPSSSGGGTSTSGRKEKTSIVDTTSVSKPRFSTFGYDNRSAAPGSNILIMKTPTSSTKHGKVHLAQESIEMEPLNTSSKQIHQHQHSHQHQHKHLPQYQLCQFHQEQHRQQQLQQQQKQHQHISTAITNISAYDPTIPASIPVLAPSSTSIITAVHLGQRSGTGSSGGSIDDYNSNVSDSDISNKNKQQQQQQKMDESKIFIDIRHSAPDVIIMTSH